MFDTGNLPCYLERMGHKKLKIGQDEFKGTEIVLRIDPFTPELASELAETKGVIFRRNDGEPNPHVDMVSFTYAPKAQRIEFRPDPQLKPSVVIPEAKVSAFRVRKPKDGTQWVLRFRIVFAEIAGADLLYLKEALFEQRFLTFENAETGLFDEAEKAAKRDAREAKPVRRAGTSDGATAH